MGVVKAPVCNRISTGDLRKVVRNAAISGRHKITNSALLRASATPPPWAGDYRERGNCSAVRCRRRRRPSPAYGRNVNGACVIPPRRFTVPGTTKAPSQAYVPTGSVPPKV